MAVLTSSQRSTLEKAVVQARKLAEQGARNALHNLAVDQPDPYAHMDLEQRALRNRLRSKARLLGDELLPNGRQEIGRLTYELAYEYWHKMLFARFLEANNLLMHPSGVAVTLEECEELAPEEGLSDKWMVAASYASRMLPAIFRPGDPLVQAEYTAEDRIRLETVLDELEDEVFTAADSLGWVYQFWQSEAKNAINASNDKIDGARLPAVTQLFTEPYMVHFLIDNTIGAWWISRHPGQTPPLPFAYLRRLDDGSPAAGSFEGWPATAEQLTLLDPCMGSGHFVAACFQTMAHLRMREEGLSREEAAARVIAENLHGLELDPRCTQIAAFNLALAAWKFCGHYLQLPEMNLACSGMAPKGKLEDWKKLLGREPEPAQRQRLENGLVEMFRLFSQAPELGSLIDPTEIRPDAFRSSFEELQPYLESALSQERDQDQAERGVIAAGIALAGKLLSQKYTLQITNVPYLSRGKQDKALADYCLRYYGDAKGDLATVFLDRMLKSAAPAGSVCTVIPQNWLFLGSYQKFRERLLKGQSWDFLAMLGPGAFSQISGEVVKAILLSISNTTPDNSQAFAGLDVSGAPNAAEKDEALKKAAVREVKQLEQLGNPDGRVVLERQGNHELLSKYCYSFHGLTTGDMPRMKFEIWEVKEITTSPIWIYFQGTVKKTSIFSGNSSLLRWEKGKGAISELLGARKDGTEAWGQKGILISQIGALPVTTYSRTAFDNNTAVIVPINPSHLPAIWCFCSSPQFNEEVRKIDKALKVTNATLVKVPFDLEHWQKVATEKYPNGLPQPYSDDPTQWLFHGHPAKAERPLQVAMARLLGYRWPAESDEAMELAPEARELIRAVREYDYLSDEDGILCLPPVNEEYAAAERLRAFLQFVYGQAWNHGLLGRLLAQEGSKKASLEDWLRDEFFEQHYKLFHHRPFLWHIWDGRQDGFGAIVNYHMLTKENLSKLIYTYLGDWLRQCEQWVRMGESGAEGRRLAAQQLKAKLERILEGEPPYDIFVRWKSLAQQPLGWDPDLNDGVRLNIRPFMTAEVLRKKPNIKWGVDRGKNPKGSYWGEVRDNDLHFTLGEKRGAREIE